MENTDKHIEKFISRVKNRLNTHFGLTVLIGSLTAGGTAMTAIALSYIMHGYHVPLFWYGVCFSTSLFLGGCLWLYFRNSHDQAAKFTDKFFALKDSVRSYSGFHKAGRGSGFYKLQAMQTESSISSISINNIRYKCPICLVAITFILILCSALCGFKGDSPAVKEKIAQEKFLLESTQLINQQIDNTIEQIQKELEEKNLDKIVDMNEVRQKAKELEETPDIKEAMRQYAQLERELGEVLSKLTQRQDEQLLERMGKELQKEDETKALGNQLTAKEYDNASEEIEKFKIDPEAEKEIQKDQIENLKEMAARMAEEAGKTQTAGNQQSSQGQTQTDQQASQKQTQNSQQANQNQQSNGSRLAQMTQQLNKSAQALSQALQQSAAANNQGQNGQSQNNQMQNGQSQNGQQVSGQMQQMTQSANQGLGNMSQFLQQMDAKLQAQAMMQGMLNSLAQSQAGLGQMLGTGQMPGTGNMAGQQSQSPSPNAGGREAGVGSSFVKNTEPGKDAPNGELTKLQGTQGSGSSVTSLEEAGSGSGSTLGTLERDPQEFMRQVESFIRREDVPESVKAGVKAYFENIHKTNEGN